MWEVVIKFETYEAALAFQGMLIREYPTLNSRMEEVYL